MMNEMMKLCCSEDGKPDFEKIKQFMEHCAKQKPGGEEAMNKKGCCAQEGPTGVEKQKD